MTTIKCNDSKWEAHVCNLRTRDIEHWLYQHVGRRWYEWDWDNKLGFGHITIHDTELALLFKLRFGI